MSTEMYRIREEEVRIQIPCERCAEKGIVDKTCFKCGGKGVHNKTLKVWRVHPRTITIDKIDRASKDSYYKGELIITKGELQYWEDMSNFYTEHTKNIHFTKKDAHSECNERNKDILPLLKVYEQNKNIANVTYKIGDKFILPKVTIIKAQSDNYQKETIYTNVKAEIVDIQEFDIKYYMIKFDDTSMIVKQDYLDKLTRI